MSKVAVLSTVGVAGAGLSVTGAYMLGAFGDASYLAKDLKEFKDSWGGTCAQSLFPGLKLGIENKTKLGSTGGTGNKVDNNSFNDSDASTSSEESCLIVNWERDNYTIGSSEKGSGNFRGSWSFKNKKGDKGFVLFALAKPSELAQQLDFTT